MNKFKKAFLLLMLLLPSALWADGGMFFTVTTTGGVNTTFFLTEDPVITYEGDNLVVTSTEKTITVAANQVVSINLEGLSTPTGIHQAETSRPAITHGQAHMTGLPAGSQVQLFNEGGQLLDTLTASADGDVTLDLNKHPRGIVIVKTATQTFKITNK